MKLVLSPRAVQRLREIADTIAADNPQAAIRVENAIRNSFDLLVTYPRAGRILHPKLRRFVVPSFPFVILYRLDEPSDRIIIATIRHGAQRPLLPK